MTKEEADVALAIARSELEIDSLGDREFAELVSALAQKIVWARDAGRQDMLNDFCRRLKASGMQEIADQFYEAIRRENQWA